MTRARSHRRRGLLAAALLMAACATAGRDGLDVARLPVEIRPDYAVFARRCSKCHQLARPLGSGIHDDGRWAAYVERMRRQPASGISRADTTPILRFLHYYSSSYLAVRGGAGESD
jgi:mono/diheme cytochrome c family protein